MTNSDLTRELLRNMAETAATRLTELSGVRRGYQSLHDEDGGDDGQAVQEEGE